MKTLTKLCLVCGIEFAKPYSCGIPEWETRKFCTRKCSYVAKLCKKPWNKGIKTGLVPKTGFKKGQRPSPKTEFRKGHKPWNKKEWFCKKCSNRLESKGLYCSKECKSTARKKPRPTKNCVVCSAAFIRKYSEDNLRWASRKVCSRVCQYGIQGQKRESNPNWKGGISPLMNQIRGLTEYRNWVRAIFRRDDWTCQYCKARSGNGKKIVLNADHIKQFSLIIKEHGITSIEKAIRCKELWDTNNGRTLCEACHKIETVRFMKTL